VHPSRLTLIVPTGAPSGSEITSVGAGARRCSSLKAKRSRSRRFADGSESCRRFDGCGGFNSAQRLAERIRIVRFDRGNTAPRKSEAGKNGFGHCDGLRKAGNVVQGFGAQKEAYARRAVGECRDDGFQSVLVDGKRQHIGRQAGAMAGERIDQRRAVLAVMEQDDGLGAACLIISEQHGTKLMQQSVGRWHGLGGRTGRTRRRALAASGADFRADLDVVAIRRNRAGRAKVEKAVAAGDV